jgi:Flp pilus assembly protein TadG
MPLQLAISSRATRASGTAALEFAIIFPIAIFLILGLCEFGRAMWTQATLDYAVQAAARCGALGSVGCSTAAQIQSYAVGTAPALPVTTANFTVTTPSCGTQVSGTFAYSFVVPALFPYQLTMTATACFPS